MIKFLPMEDEMKRSTMTFSLFAITSAMTFAIAAPVSADTNHATHMQRVARHHAIPASAEALSPSMFAPALRRDDDFDGLTRNTSECNRGCIDN